MTAPMVCVPVEPDWQAKALADFTEYFVRNYPGPNTIIGDPYWHAPRIYRAAKFAIESAAPAPPQAVQGEAAVGDGLLREVCAELTGLECGPSIGSMAPWEDLHGRIVQYLANNPTPAMPIAASGDVEQHLKVLREMRAVADMLDDEEAAALDAAIAALRSQGQAVAVVTDAMVEAACLSMCAHTNTDWQEDYTQSEAADAREGIRAALTAALAQQANKDAP